MSDAPHTGNQINPDRKQVVIGLLHAGYTVERIAKALKMSPNSIVALKSKKDEIVAADKLDSIKKGLAAKFWQKADNSLNNITDEKLLKLNADRLAVTAAILTEKALLMEGKATNIVDYRALSEDIIDVDAQIVELEKKVAAAQPSKLIEQHGGHDG